MSRYCLRGRWYMLKPNSKLRYDSDSDSEAEDRQDAKKPIESCPKLQENIPSKDNLPSNLPQSKVTEPKARPKIRKILNL